MNVADLISLVICSREMFYPRTIVHWIGASELLGAIRRAAVRGGDRDVNNCGDRNAVSLDLLSTQL